MQKDKHSVEVIEPCLEIDEHLSLMEKGWVVQRIGWGLIITIMLAGAVGFFGDGPFSKKTVTSGAHEVNYERFFRHEAEMNIVITSSVHISSISFSQPYLNKFKVVRFVPEAINNNTENNTVKYNFTPGQNRLVTAYIITNDYGRIEGTMRVNDTDKIQLNHFIYP